MTTPVEATRRLASEFDVMGRDGSSPDHPELHNTDLGNAGRLVERHGPDFRYCTDWRRFLVWDGRRFAKDTNGEAERRAKDTVRALYADASLIEDEKERKRMADWAITSEAEKRIAAMINLAKTEPGIPVTAGELDSDPWALNVLNGTIDLQTEELRTHTQVDLISKLTPIEYDPDAECRLWLDFLDRVMGGNERLIDFLQQAVGYTLTGDATERVLFILHGAGANGKTTFLRVIQALLGEYAVRTNAETLLVKRPGAIPNDIAALDGARFVFAAEVERGRRFAEALVKEVTGGDQVSARFMRAEWFSFDPKFKFWLATNHKPEIRGTDNAIWDRIRLVPFTEVIPPEEPDRRLRDRLLEELPGILTWAIRGAIRWKIEDGLVAPDEVQLATGEYRSEMDLLGNFIDDRCVLGEHAEVVFGDLFEAYEAWCERNRERSVSKRALGMALSERGFTTVRLGAKQARGWKGIGLQTE